MNNFVISAKGVYVLDTSVCLCACLQNNWKKLLTDYVEIFWKCCQWLNTEQMF